MKSYKQKQRRVKDITRPINTIIVHCTATEEGRDYTAEDVDRWHRQQGWSMIGHHYLIRLDGTIELGRDLSEPGAHCRGYNTDSIGVAYVGGLDGNGEAKDTRTKDQKIALRSLLQVLKSVWPNAEICGHRDKSPDRNGDGQITSNEWIKECPCFDAKKEYEDVTGDVFRQNYGYE